MKQTFQLDLGWWAKFVGSTIFLLWTISLHAQTCSTAVVTNMALVPCSTGHKIQFTYVNNTGVNGSVNVSLGSGTNLKYQECITLPVCSTQTILSSACFTNGSVFDTLFKTVHPFTNCQPCISLPVHFISFNAEKSSSGVKLFWEAEVVNESNAMFKVEKSTDGVNFSMIALVFADQAVRKYFFTDNSSPGNGKIFYRLRFTSSSGSDKLSPVRLVSFEKFNEVKTFVDGSNTIRIQGLEPGKTATAFVYSMDGRMIAQKQSTTDEMLSAGISASNLTTGIYVIRITTDVQVYNGKFAKL